MTNHRKRHRLRAVTALTLFLAAVAVSALASTTDVLPGTAGQAGRGLAVLLVVVLGVRALWWLGVDGRRPDMSAVLADRADRKAARR